MNSSDRILNDPLIDTNIHIKNEFLNSISSYPSINAEYIRISRDLLEMGYELQMIEMVFCFFNVVSVERGIELMTKENGTWQHNYIEGEDKSCVVCNECCDHLNLKMNSSEGSLSRISKFKSNSYLNGIAKKSFGSHGSNILSNSDPPFSQFSGDLISIKDIKIAPNCKNKLKLEENKNCLVCDGEVPEDCFLLSCGHKFCHDCWVYYLEEKIKNSQVN